MQTWSSNRLAGLLAAFVGAGGLLYGVLFALISRGSTGAVVQIWLVLGILGGLAVTGVFVALYEHLKSADHFLAVWAVLLGVVAGLGQMLNASVALAGVIQGPAAAGVAADPIGVLRFGLNGVALFLFGWVMISARAFPRDLGYLGLTGGVLLIVMYAGRLTGFVTPANEITLLPPLVYGFVVHPIFYLWLARHLTRSV